MNAQHPGKQQTGNSNGDNDNNEQRQKQQQTTHDCCKTHLKEQLLVVFYLPSKTDVLLSHRGS
jgi:hypothetical protein